MDLTIKHVTPEDISIRCYKTNPELSIHLSLKNEDNKHIGSYHISSQKHFSDVHYIMSNDLQNRIKLIVNEIMDDLLTNYITYDITNG